MRFCTSCGKKVAKDMKFCPNCGQRLIAKERNHEIKANGTADVRSIKWIEEESNPIPRPEQNRFAESVLSFMRDTSKALITQLQKARDNNYLTESENGALIFLTAGPYLFADSLLSDEKSPLYGAKRADASSEDVAAKAYSILQFTLLHVLRELMHNSPEVAAAIGTQHTDLVRKYCTILGYSASDVELWLSHMDSDMLEVKEGLHDPTPAWFCKFRKFHETLTSQLVNTGGLFEDILFSSTWDELLIRWSRGLRKTLGVKN